MVERMGMVASRDIITDTLETNAVNSATNQIRRKLSLGLEHDPLISSIDTWTRSKLIDCWREAYGRPPPVGISRRLLQYAVAYHLQARAFGGLSAASQRKLFRTIDQQNAEQTSRGSQSAKRRLPAGSRLVREWSGRTHTVDVLDSGFLFDGQIYASLSAIARAITGAHWSGTRFFGL